MKIRSKINTRVQSALQFNTRSKKNLKTLNTLILSSVLAACGKNKNPNEPVSELINAPEVENITLTPILSEGVDYISSGTNKEIISSNYSTIKTLNLIKDSNTTDNDQLIIATSEDVTSTPNISGFEEIQFTVNGQFTPNDPNFDINLENVTDFNSITISVPSTITTIDRAIVSNASGNLVFDSNIDNISINAATGEDISLVTKENAVVYITNNAENVTIDGGGRSLNISSTNIGDITVLENSSVILNAQNAKENINIVSNGNVTIGDVNALTGNIEVSSVGDISLNNAGSVNGKIELDNLRAIEGNDISITDARNAKSIDIASVGAVTAKLNGGFSSAESIIIKAAEDSTIFASGNVPSVASLTAENSTNSEITFDLDIDTLSQLNLKGSVPILVTANGDDINGTTVTTSNSSTSSLLLTGANTDLSNIASNIEVRLKNFDGKSITVGQNQNIAIDAEIPQTATAGIPIYNFETDATSLSSNTISLKIIDTNNSNLDNLATIAGLSLNDVQTVNFDLSNGVDFQTSQNITGPDLQTIKLSGTGNFNLQNSTIVGGLNSAVSLTSQNYTGNLTATIDNTINGLKNITSGAGDDIVAVNGAVNVNPSVSVNTSDGNDTISLMSDSDGNSVILSINGGNGVDKVKFAAGLDFSLSNFTLTAVENLEFTGGSTTVKVPSSVMSTKAYNISENGTGTLTLEVFPTAQVINLSSLSFDTSVVSGTDIIIVNGLNYSQALTITGSSIGDNITGTHTSADTISSGDGNDTINGSDGNDTLTPGNGLDHITSGLGTDTINLSEVVGASDTLYYGIDDGPSNVDIVTGFDVRVANDVISLDVSATSAPITYGNGTAATATGLGNIIIYEHNLDTNLNYSSNAAASIIKLTAVTEREFAKALGSSEITVANDSTICFLWFDSNANQAVFGYANENTASASDDKIKADDTFVEITRLSMTASNYTHYLDTENFVFI